MDGVRPVTIVGAGPAGISAAIYLQRAGFEPLLLEEDVPGGLLRRAGMIENYPGFPEGIPAARLVGRFIEHLQAVGGSVERASVERISRNDDGTYTVSTPFEADRTRAAIVATGTRPRMVAIEGARAAQGHQLFYDLLELLERAEPGERIVIYGGGDAAFDLGLNLRHRGYETAIVCRSRARCLPLLRARAERDGIRVMEGRSITRVASGERLTLELDGASPVEADRLLIACGREPRLDILEPPLGALLRSDDTYAAGVPGLYLAGDVAADGRRQVGIAVGSGINAAMLAEQYLRRR